MSTDPRAAIIRALDECGAQVGDCGHEPGDVDQCDNGCAALLGRYADAILAALDVRTPEFIMAQRDAGWPDMHPEDYCHQCGRRNMSWCAASRDDWLTATSEWASRTGREGICCPECFDQMFRDATGSKPIWMLTRWGVSDETVS